MLFKNLLGMAQTKKTEELMILAQKDIAVSCLNITEPSTQEQCNDLPRIGKLSESDISEKTLSKNPKKVRRTFMSRLYSKHHAYSQKGSPEISVQPPCRTTSVEQEGASKICNGKRAEGARTIQKSFDYN